MIIYIYIYICECDDPMLIDDFVVPVGAGPSWLVAGWLAGWMNKKN